MQSIIRAYRLLNLLSLDVVGGAVCSALFFARLFGVAILPYGLMALALTVWIVYTTDHLLDAARLKGPASTQRHQFHQRNFRVLSIVLLTAILTDCIIIYFIRRPVFYGGIFLIAGVGLYLLVQHYTRFLKEIFIAVLYTAGVILPSAAVTSLSIEAWPWWVIVQFLVTALLNLLIFSWFDRENDSRDKATSFVTVLGEHTTRMVIWGAFVVVFVLLVVNKFETASMLLAVSDLCLLIIFLRPTYFINQDRFRLMGDAVFYLLILYLWL